MSSDSHKPRAYESALRSLQSLAPNFLCSVCQEALEDPYLASCCLHRFCRKCIIGSACPSCSKPILNLFQVQKDSQFDQVVSI